MTTGLIFEVDGEFDGPVVTVDPRLCDGSLLLIDPGHPVAPWDEVAAPVTIANIAAETAAAMLGNGNAATFGVSNTLTSASGIVERSAKGGVHVIATTAGGASERWYATMHADVVAYLTAHASDHAFYLSLWGRITRASTYTTSLASVVGILTSGSGAKLSIGQSGTTGNIGTFPGSPTGGRVTATLASGLGAFRADIGHQGYTSASIVNQFFRAGNWFADIVNKAPSIILYAAHLIDLTIAGMTYAEASAIDQAAHAAAFGTGGRYAGDSWTNPAMV